MNILKLEEYLNEMNSKLISDKNIINLGLHTCAHCNETFITDNFLFTLFCPYCGNDFFEKF